jgi:hypothetical protein
MALTESQPTNWEFPLLRQPVLAAARPSVLWRWSSEQLAERFNASGLTTHELGVLTGRSAAAISLYLRGEKVPPADVIGLLAAVLRCEPNDLFDAVDASDAAQRAPSPTRRKRNDTSVDPP